MNQFFGAMVEALRMVREGSESTGRTVRTCLLFVVFLGGTLGAAAWMVHVLGT